MTRDLRDPEAVGRSLEAIRRQHPNGKLSKHINRLGAIVAPDYDGGGWMSSNPALHHSQTPQNLGDLND